jgi:hypothetical protein
VMMIGNIMIVPKIDKMCWTEKYCNKVVLVSFRCPDFLSLSYMVLVNLVLLVKCVNCI